jgi:hypothetical protein
MATIIIRNSTGSGVIPSSLQQGELAINTKDGKLFYGSGSGNIVKEFKTETGSFATTGSNTFNGNQIINGNVTISGTASISTLVVNQTQYSSGSNQLGDAANDTQTLYGTVVIPTGSLTVSGSIIASGSDATINGVRVGRGGGNQLSNTAVGNTALSNNTTGTANTAVGYLALGSNNTTGTSNSAFGYLALRFSTGGSNSAFGTTALYGITAGSNNSAFGRDAGYYIADGTTALTAPSSGVFLGANTKALTQGSTNEIVIGQNAIGLGSNSAVLGNDSITRTALKGSVSIGTTGSISSTLHVKGAGATSGTTALRVENTNASASLVVLDNGYVGINTGSAQYNLDVNGTARVSGNLTLGGTTAIGGGYGVTSGTFNIIQNGPNIVPTSGTMVINGFAYTGTINQTGGANGITRGLYINPTLTSAADFRAIETTAGNVLFQSGSTPLMLVSSSGNVGIGTTSSIAPLQVGPSTGQYLRINPIIDTALDTGFSTSRVLLSTNATTTFGASYSPTNGNGGIRLGSVGSYSYIVGGTNLLLNPVGGNVGIGLITPSASLHISGASNSVLLEIDSPAVNNILYVSGSGNVGIATNTSAYRLQIDASGSSNSSLPLALTSVDANNRVGILFASSSVSSGKQHRLWHRVNTPTVEWLLGTSAGETATWRFLPQDNTNYAINILTPYNGGTAYITTGLSQSLFSLGAGSQTAQHINISSSGNVGIGTSTPATALEVNGVIRTSQMSIGGFDSGRNQFLTYTAGPVYRMFSTLGSYASLGVGSFSVGSTYGGISGSVNTVLIEGNTSIGTTTQSARLHVQGSGTTSATTALRVENTNASASLVVLDNGYVGINTGSAQYNLDVNGTARLNGSTTFGTLGTGTGMFWDNTNNRLGIGNSAPTYNLDIVSSSSPNIRITRNGATEIRIGASTLATGGLIGTYSASPLIFLSNSVESMRLFTTGNVAIGTTTDIASSKLTVESTTQGFLPPRMTNAQRLAIATPAVGLMVYCTDTIEGLYINKSTGWTFIA